MAASCFQPDEIWRTPPILDKKFAFSPSFQYRRLENEAGQIRLVRVNDADNSKATIELDLITVDLEDPPEYIAMSYTWGRPGPNFPAERDNKNYLFSIIISGCKFAVRPNLFYALIQIRERMKSSTLWWIDAICIG